MSIPAEHLSLFKADWIGDHDRLKALALRFDAIQQPGSRCETSREYVL